MRHRVVLVCLMAFVCVAPIVSGQAGHPVTACSQQCLPTDPDVNGPDPRSGDEASSAILYAHFGDILNRAPTNVQLPNAAIDPELNGGFVMPVVNTETNTPADLHFMNNWFEMFSSAGLVEIGPNGERITNQAPGLADRLSIASDVANLYMYLSAFPLPDESSSSTPLGSNVVDVMPQVAIYARLETGRHRFQGDLIAEGDTGNGDVADLAGGRDRVNVLTLPGQADVYEFQVPMQVTLHEVPAVYEGVYGFLLSVNPYQVKLKDGPLANTQVMQADWRFRSGPDLPPRLVLEIDDALASKAASVSGEDKQIHLDWSVLSPWGNYDLDRSSLVATVVGPDGLARVLSPTVVANGVDHDAPFKPTNVRWTLDGSSLPNGAYTAKLSALNLQHTYDLGQALTFDVAGGHLKK